MGDSLGSSLLLSLKLFDLVSELLRLETFFGDPGSFRSRSFLQRTKLLVIPSKFCALIIQTCLGNVMGVL
jgi:hypothetical protein